MAVKGRKQPEKEKKREPKIHANNGSVSEMQDRGKTEPVMDTQLTALERDLERLKIELRPVEVEKKAVKVARLQDILPSWVEKPWMYVTPTDPDQLQSWGSTWGDFLLEFAEFKAVHILNLLEARKEFPFSNRLIKKKLSMDQMQLVGQNLIDRDFGAWWDERKTRLRIYWKVLEEWSEIIYEWALQTGRELVSLFELANACEIWSSLPQEELQEILRRLVTRNLAKWVGKGEITVLFHF